MKDYTIESTLTRSVVERSLVDEVAQLLQHRTEEGLCWRGSLTDLTEALHVAASTGLLTDAYGRCITFRDLLGSVCRLFRLAPPRNPYETARRAARRKGLHNNPYMNRYRYMLTHSGLDSRPLLNDITGI